MATPNKLSKKDALAELWHRGVLSWMLDSSQKELYALYYKTDHKVQTWLLSRRSGKTRTLIILALEQCLREPNTIVKFLSPTKLQCNNNVRPLMKELLNTCPDSLKPEFKKQDYIYYFPNGSEIQLAGSDGGHAEKLRGGSSWISIVDEAGDVRDLENIVRSVLLPTTLTTKGKIILAGTPPKSTDHEFLKFIEEAELRGSLVKKTVYDNPRLTPEQIQDLEREYNGKNNDAWRREMLCEIIKDSSRGVIPEFTKEVQDEVVKEWPKPPFYDCYVSMDIGFNDLTVVLFAYYDFRADKVVVEDEYVINGTDFHIPKLTDEIRKKEESYWTNYLTNEVKKPYMRVCDTNPIVINEIRRYSNNIINFQAAKKDDNDAAINNLRIMIANKKIIIHPRCTTLIRHLRNVKWSSSTNKTIFARSPDDGHYDAVDALKYLVRTIVYSKNPYPAGYGLNLRSEDVFINNKSAFSNNNPVDVYRRIFGTRKR